MSKVTRIPQVVALWCVLLALSATHAADIRIAPQRFELRQDGHTCYLPYVSSHPLTEANPGIRKLLVALHSSSYDAFMYLRNGREAARRAGVLDETLILVPHWLRQQHVTGPDTPDNLLYWDANPFWGSQLSRVTPDARPLRFSSYELLDQLLDFTVVRERFPQLQSIIFVGHSAGGQFAQRYAAVGRYQPPAGISVRYVVCAPSSYAYPTRERLAPGDTFAEPTPAQQANCKFWNNWGYGLDEPYRYVREGGVENVRQRFASRHVFYLCGEHDNNPDHASLSKTCASMLQGAQRLERMLTFEKYLRHTYGPHITRRHRFAVTPGVGHSGFGNMTSEPGLRFLFAPLDESR